MPPNVGHPGHPQGLTYMSQNNIMPLSTLQHHQHQMHFGYGNKITKSPPLKPARKFREDQEAIQRCKKRIQLGQLSTVLQGRSRSSSQLRRNERERNRVRMINMTFARLRQHIPDGYCKNKNKKLSKVDTLRGAIDYINGLQDLLDEDGSETSAFDDVLIPQRLSSSGSSTSLESAHDKENVRMDSLSDGSESPGSASEVPSSDGDDSGVEMRNLIKQEMADTFSPEEEDLLDFNSWFQ